MASSSRGKEKPVLPNVGEAGNQPLDFNYWKREFGKTKVVRRAFQAQWFAKWPWLHYDTAQDLAFCHCSCFWNACIVDRERQGFWCMEIMYTDHNLFVIMHIVCIYFLPPSWNMNASLLLFCSIRLSILTLVLVHGCKIAPELKKTTPRFQNFPGGHAPRYPSLRGGVNGLTGF